MKKSDTRIPTMFPTEGASDGVDDSADDGAEDGGNSGTDGEGVDKLEGSGDGVYCAGAVVGAGEIVVRGSNVFSIDSA